MLNRLLASDTIKAPFVGQPQFSVNKKFLAFAVQSAIRIKCLYREAKQHDIIIKNEIQSYKLSFKTPHLITLDKGMNLKIHKLKIQQGAISSENILSIEKIVSFEEIGNGLTVIDHQNTLKFIDFSNIQMIQPISSFKQQTTILKNSNNTIYTFNSEQKYIFSRSTIGKYSKIGQIHLNGVPIAVYNDRYLFYVNQNLVTIYDASNTKIIGKFKIDGKLVYAEIRQNLLLIVSNTENTDFCQLYALKKEPKHDQPLITNRVVFQKSKGYSYESMIVSRLEAPYYIESKKKDREVQQNFPSCLDIDNMLLVFCIAKQKQKIEVIKIENSKILEIEFCEQSVGEIIPPPSPKKQIEQIQQVQMEKIKVQSAIEIDKAEKPENQIKIGMIEKIIDKKLQLFAIKFLDLEKRVTNLEKVIHKIYRRMEDSIKSLNTTDVKKTVQNLFSELTPQFQQYFVEVFKQISSVMEQGVNYYNFKLAKQAELHKEVLTQIVHLSLRATEEIVDLGRKQLQFSQRAQQYLKTLTTLKKNWVDATDNFQMKLKDMKEKQTNKLGGKIFVKADLNSQEKKQT